jgi:hypothetical protein
MRRECHHLLIGSFDEDAVLELRARSDQRDEVEGVTHPVTLPVTRACYADTVAQCGD